MRVISGAFKGRILRAPRSLAFRPTTDRVKETLFNILAARMAMDGVRVCDLFAGSGSLGIEALSRGAARACFVENDRGSLKILNENVRVLGLEKVSEVLAMSVERFLSGASAVFDLFLADPPYSSDSIPTLLELISARGLLSGGGLLCAEHDGRNPPRIHPDWKVESKRNFGTTGLLILAQK